MPGAVKVIGVTGMPGSGKSEAVAVARERGIPVVRMGDLIWEEVERQGLPREARQVGRVADQMRKEHGPDVWALRTAKRVREVASGAAEGGGVASTETPSTETGDEEPSNEEPSNEHPSGTGGSTAPHPPAASPAGLTTVVIDGIRSLHETEVLRRELGDDFVLVAVTSPRALRFSRMLARGRDDDPKGEAVLRERDEREESWGVRQVIAAADVTIANEGDLASFRHAFKDVLQAP